jgi:DNA (cytosine-5)-methyltransferase 1
MKEFTFGSLFSGIGGLDLGLERSGMKLKWQVEKEEYERRVLEKNWPDVKRFADVRECGFHNLEPVDLIAGGFPCQDVSFAGKRKGLGGDRTVLWSEFARIIRELRPKWVLAENVPGLLSSDSGRFFGKILGDLASIGYDAEWDCIPAGAFGAPHLRYRLFVVAYRSIERTGTIPIRSRRQNKTKSNINGNCKGMDANADGKGQVQSWTFRIKKKKPFFESCGNWRQWWRSEPELGRVVHGIPYRVDRIRGLGNSIVPQVAEWHGILILRAENEQENNNST